MRFAEKKIYAQLVRPVEPRLRLHLEIRGDGVRQERKGMLMFVFREEKKYGCLLRRCLDFLKAALWIGGLETIENLGDRRSALSGIRRENLRQYSSRQFGPEDEDGTRERNHHNVKREQDSRPEMDLEERPA